MVQYVEHVFGQRYIDSLNSKQQENISGLDRILANCSTSLSDHSCLNHKLKICRDLDWDVLSGTMKYHGSKSWRVLSYWDASELFMYFIAQTAIAISQCKDGPLYGLQLESTWSGPYYAILEVSYDLRNYLRVSMAPDRFFKAPITRYIGLRAVEGMKMTQDRGKLKQAEEPKPDGNDKRKNKDQIKLKETSKSQSKGEDKSKVKVKVKSENVATVQQQRKPKIKTEHSTPIQQKRKLKVESEDDEPLRKRHRKRLYPDAVHVKAYSDSEDEETNRILSQPDIKQEREASLQASSEEADESSVDSASESSESSVDSSSDDSSDSSVDSSSDDSSDTEE